MTEDCIGDVPLGSFCSSNCQVSGVLGANPDDAKILHDLNIGPPLQEILHTQVVGEAICQCFGWIRPVWIDIVLDATRHQLTLTPQDTN